MSELTQQFCEQLDEFTTQWNSAELTMKLAEQVSEKAVYPSVNELRYAGRKLVDALKTERQAPGSEKAKALLRDAIFDCYRAKHDAIDVAIAVIAGRIDVAERTLGLKNITASYPKWHDLRASVSKINRKIRLSREDRDNRDLIYDSIHEVELPKIVDDFKIFEDSEERISEEVKLERHRSLVMITFTILGFLVAVIGIIFDMMG